MGRVAKGIATFGASEGYRAGKNWFSGGGDDELNAMLESKNKEALYNALNFRGSVQKSQERLLPQYENLAQQANAKIAALETPENSSKQLANVEIERRRRSLGLGAENQTRALNAGIARRGLGNSASGLFASLNAQRGLQNRMDDLESSRFGLQRGIEQENLQTRGNLLNQYNAATGGLNALISGAQIPTIDFSKSQNRWQKYGPAIGGFLNDRIKAGEQMAGQAAGSMGGMFASSQGYKKDIHDLDSNKLLKLVNNLNLVSFKYKPEFDTDKEGKIKIGVIAEKTHDAFTNKEKNMVDLYNLVFALAGSVQSLNKKIEKLEAKHLGAKDAVN